MSRDTSVLLAGRYRLESVIGDGGMGRVWRARDETLDRAVAVKEVRFPADVSDRERESLGERTMREARLTAQLDHPGVVTTYDAVVDEGRPYIVMELVPSTSLAARIAADGALPEAEVRRLGRALLDALAAAHRRGIVHRDVKPSNVLLADDGRVLLTDFGIAVRDSDPSLTATGLLIGSPAYMSPERLRGHRAGPEADVWSLGATLYAALEGRPPFGADTTIGTITSILTDEMRPPETEGQVAAAVAAMLAKDARDRPGLDDVRPLLAEPEPVTDPGPAPVAPAQQAWPSWLDVPAVRPGAGGGPQRPREARGGDRDRPGGRRAMLVVAGVVVLALLAGLVGWLSGGGSSDTSSAESSRSGSTGRAGSSSTGDGGRADRQRDQSSRSPQRSAGSSSGSAVPDGYRVRRDPLGFRVAVPQGWQRRLDGPTRVDFVAPDGGSFVRIDQRAQALPSAAKAWRDAEPGVADSLPGYRRIRIDPVPHPRWNVADWEFTWEGDSGTVHVLNRGIATDTRGFALYVSVPDDAWQQRGEPLFDVVSRTFEPTS